MAKCDSSGCDELLTYLPFKCRYCGGSYCKKHRLPENHGCSFSLSENPRETTSIKQEKNFIITNTTRKYGKSPDVNSDNEEDLEKEMRRYIADQERSSMPRPPTQSSPRYRNDHNPFISRSNEINVTYWLMSLTAIFTILNLFSVEIGKYLLLNTNNLFSNLLYIPSLFTSMFTINGDPFNILISLLFAEFMLYSFGKTIEIQFGPKFIKTLYFTAGCIAVSIVIIIQILGPILIQTNGLVPSNVSIQWCTILTILTFLLYIIGLEREIRTFLFFIPMRIKPKYLLGFLIIYASIFAIMGIFDSGIPTELYLAELVCIYLGKVFYQKYGKTMLNQFF